MLLEKHDKDTKSLARESVNCYDDDTNEEDELDENDDDRERLRKDDKFAHSAIYKSLRKVIPEPESLSPPPPVPQSTNEIIMQRDQHLLYDTTSRKRYHTSPHDKHRVSEVTNLAVANLHIFLC